MVSGGGGGVAALVPPTVMGEVWGGGDGGRGRESVNS